MDRLLVLLVVIVLIGLLTALWRARDGRVRAHHSRSRDNRATDAPNTDGADLIDATAPTTPLVLVEFTAPGCQPCVRTRAILEEVGAGHPEVSVAVVDIAEAGDLVRAHGIMRAPTTLLVGCDGRLFGRVAGVPRTDELTGMVDAATSTLVR